jgi:phosphonate transport system ATP-binding protein
MIEFNDVEVTYPNGFQALRGMTVSIADGELVVIVGLSGAGKSTFLRAINGFVPITGGSVKVNGIEVRGASNKTLRELRSQVGMIYQTFNLVNRTTVINNVLTGRLSKVGFGRAMLGMWPAADKELSLQALERVELIDKSYVRASNLSGGQQQRVGIARALAQEPKVLLADEPVASLDPVTSHTVMRDLRRINRDLGITTIINLHFLDLARSYGKRLIGLQSGELVYDGDIADVSEETFREIYGRSVTPDDLLEGADL